VKKHLACRFCGKTFGGQHALNQHAQMKHGHEKGKALMCAYCADPAKFMPSSAAIYGKDYGPVWACLPCGAWVGCHPGTEKPLGTLANAELRAARSLAHSEFDPIWKRGYMTRAEAYAELAKRLGIAGPKCHIGRFDVGMCEAVVGVCRIMGPEMRERALVAA
jgi:hypothetical protein